MVVMQLTCGLGVGDRRSMSLGRSCVASTRGALRDRDRRSNHLSRSGRSQDRVRSPGIALTSAARLVQKLSEADAALCLWD